MKTAVLAVTILSLGAASLTSVQAGDREWATAGRVLTGVVAAGVIANALQPHYERTVVYQTPAPAVVYAPAPQCQPYRPAPATVVYYSTPPQVVYVEAPHRREYRPYHPYVHFGVCR